MNPRRFLLSINKLAKTEDKYDEVRSFAKYNKVSFRNLYLECVDFKKHKEFKESFYIIEKVYDETFSDVEEVKV